MSANETNIYGDCKKIIRTKPDTTVTEEVAKAIGSNFRVLPAFEKGLFDFVRIKYYSLENNEFLKCRWLKYKKNIEKRVFAPFQFPAQRDLHFYNNCIRFLPSETVNRRPEHLMKLKPGPGVDRCGQMPIPQELLMKRAGIEKSSQNKFFKKVVTKKSVEKK